MFKICIKFKHSPYIVEFELPFNILASLFIYAIPIFGIIFWYAKVPMFLWRRNNGASSLNSTVSTNANIKRFEQGKLLQLLYYLTKFSSMNFIIKRVTITVVILGAVYIICWTPYWVGIYAHYFIKIPMSKPSKCSFRINFPLIRIFCSNLSIYRADCNVLHPSATLCNVCCISNNIHSSQPSDSG